MVKVSSVLVDILFSFILIFKYAFLGFLNGIVGPLRSLFNASARGVDVVYKGTKKKVIKTKEEVIKPISPKKMAILEKKKALLLKELATEEVKKGDKAKVFEYIVKAKNGKLIKDRFTAFSKADVNSYLLNEGYEVYSIVNNKWLDFVYGEGSLNSGRWNTKDLTFWLTQLATYIKAGLTLNDAIKILVNQMGKNKRKKRTMAAVAYELTMGETFSRALEKQGHIFPNLLINMLKAAEASGALEETLEDMANYYDEMEKTRKQMITAMTYPSVVLVFAIGVITFIMLYIVPQFVDIYKSMGVEVTGLTSFLLDLSAFLQSNIILILMAIVIVVAVLIYMYKKIKAFRKIVQVIIMKIPILGKIIIYNEMTIFTKTFASLLKNNVYITDSIDILSKITNNEVYKEIMFQTIDNVAKGEKISEAFKGHWAVPDVAYYMIVTGESTGQLAEMMSRVSSYYQVQHKSIVESIKSLIEPVLIVMLAVVVGLILIAVVVPMFNFYQEIS